ncbi:hypothetical protein DL762_001810 [Monosporascus cannonballus]|uniref:Ubiquitin-like domain-containing protein n=1 Tax=Monosporascus cannonballus TaxID=155416 RepID=A0ABY0HFD0_9PEZI|nr:hypothetical protein DL762_001810 [Monosporascus cannonballus]
MEIALTFGSVGDILAICQVVIQLSRALGSTAGSVRQYQELRDDLDGFVRVLMHVIATYEQHEQGPWLNSVDKEIKRVVADCGVLVQDALDHFHAKYHKNLRPGGSGNAVKDIIKKMEWSFLEKDNLQTLHEKVKTYTERVALLTGIAARRSARVDNATMLTRIEEVKSFLYTHQEALMRLHMEHAKSIQEQTQQLRKIDDRLATQDQSYGIILSWVKNTSAAILEIKEMIGRMSRDVINLQYLASNSMFFQSLDPTRDMPVVFEDALGNVINIPMAWIHDWSGFYGLLEHYFEDKKGHPMVLRREYALEENCSGKDIDHSLPWSASFRRGMKVNMSMVFTNVPVESAPDDVEEIEQVEIGVVIDEPSDFHRVRLIMMKYCSPVGQDTQPTPTPNGTGSPQPKVTTKTPREYSIMRWERDQAVAERLAERMSQHRQQQENQRKAVLQARAQQAQAAQMAASQNAAQQRAQNNPQMAASHPHAAMARGNAPNQIAVNSQ